MRPTANWGLHVFFFFVRGLGGGTPFEGFMSVVLFWCWGWGKHPGGQGQPTPGQHFCGFQVFDNFWFWGEGIFMSSFWALGRGRVLRHVGSQFSHPRPSKTILFWGGFIWLWLSTFSQETKGKQQVLGVGSNSLALGFIQTRKDMGQN